MALFLRQPAKQTDNNDDSDDDSGTFQQQALEINLPDANFNPNAVPTNGEEFLTFMAYERRNTPAVMSRKPDAKKLKPNTADILSEQAYSLIAAADQSTNAKFQCTPAWKAWQLSHFQATRQSAHELRAKNFQNRLTIETPTTADGWLEFCRKTPPVLKEILNLGQRDLENLLEAICDWLQRGDNHAADDDDEVTNVAAVAVDAEHVDEATAAAQHNANIQHNDLKITSDWLGQWLYAILVCLNLPLEPVVHSTMREIARLFVRQRARVVACADVAAAGAADFLHPEHQQQHLNTFNIFIYIIAKFFDQLDFLEFV